MLEDSGETGYNSKTSSNGSSKFKDGGSSSESTVEESEKKLCVRPYVRSKLARLRWTPDLHLHFVHAVERLGGQDRATPKLVLQMMNIKGLSIAHVKSHLQMYRSKKMDDQGIGHHHKVFMEGGDPNLFNLIQFPKFPTYHQMLNSTFRYEDASWSCQGNWMPSNTMGKNTLDRNGRGLYTRLNQDLCTRIPSFSEIKAVIGSFRGNPSGVLTRLFHIAAKPQSRASDGNGITSPPELERAINLQKLTPLKRKVSDCDLDLNLHLGVKPRNEETTNHDDNDNDNGSSLSLSSSRITSLIEDAKIDATTGSTQLAIRFGNESRLKKVLGRDSNIGATIENERRWTSTLDLTL